MHGVNATPTDLLVVAVDIARAAGALLRQRPRDLDVDSKSTPTDAVTVMDRASERLIIDELTRRRPGDRILAEETGAHDGADATTAGVCWVVDPLDGTVNYLYGIPHFAVSIAARIDDKTVAGAVYDVMRDEMYAAHRGGGATCNGKTLQCSTQADPAMSLVATGFAYSATDRAGQVEVLRRVLPQVRDIRREGSAALDLCSVAAGRVDAYYEAGMQPWDWAAGALVAQEAGAQVGGLDGRPPGAWTTLAANPQLFATLERLLIEAGAAPVTS